MTKLPTRHKKILEPVFNNKSAADSAEYMLRQKGWDTKQIIKFDKDGKTMYVILAEKSE
jgi:hypothetical protein